MDKISSIVVHTTTDYSQFKFINGNRDIVPLHVERLKKSMQKRYLFTIIVVNENMEIIDGQNRFTAIKDLGLELNYVIMKDYELVDVQELNKNNKSWKQADFLKGYIKLGFDDYIQYDNFQKKYQLPFNESMLLLSGQDNGQFVKDVFNQGNFKIKSLDKAIEIANKLQRLEPYYKTWRNKFFVRTMVQKFKEEGFDFEHFFEVVKSNPNVLEDKANIAQCKMLVDTISKLQLEKV